MGAAIELSENNFESLFAGADNEQAEHRSVQSYSWPLNRKSWFFVAAFKRPTRSCLLRLRRCVSLSQTNGVAMGSCLGPYKPMLLCVASKKLLSMKARCSHITELEDTLMVR